MVWPGWVLLLLLPLFLLPSSGAFVVHLMPAASTLPSSSTSPLCPQLGTWKGPGGGRRPTREFASSLRSQRFPHIASTTNDAIKRLVKLREQSKFRKAEGTALIIGASPVSELAGRNCAAEGQIRSLFLTEESPSEAPWHISYLSTLPLDSDTRVATVSEAAFKRLAGVESASGRMVAAELNLPRQATVRGLRRVLIADSIQDPGNLGTLLRTASALGWEGVFLLDGCCDPHNDKCIRAARGAAWRMTVQGGSWADLRETIGASPSPGRIVVADAGGADVGDISVGDDGLWLLLSNEGAGVSPEVKRMLEGGGAWQRVGVPMPGDMESLNVAVAGGILMYMLR